MFKIPMNLHDVQILLAAEFSVCKWLAEFMVRKLGLPDGVLEDFSASLINGTDREDPIFFECTINGGKYGAYLLIYNSYPVCPAERQLYYLRKIKRTYRCREYKELKCCLIVPFWLVKREPSLLAYPAVLLWERLCDMLIEHNGCRGKYVANILRNSFVGQKQIFCHLSSGSVREY